jgi:hypothetical protein
MNRKVLAGCISRFFWRGERQSGICTLIAQR